MPTIAPRYIFCAPLALFSLAACSSGDDALRASPNQSPHEFSEEDKRAARALSVTNVEAIAKVDGPYSRALLCKIGMDVLTERFQEASALSDRHMQGLQQARSHFDRQLRVLASREGKSPSDIDHDLERTAEDHPDVAANARIAIGCLQELMEAS